MIIGQLELGIDMCLFPGYFNGFLQKCNHCPECMSSRKSDYVFRMEQEQYNNKFSKFITLTYNDNHLPFGSDAFWPDIVMFRKNLNRYLSKRVKYFVGWENGEKSGRGHWHVMLYCNRPITKEIIHRCWSKRTKIKDDKGHVHYFMASLGFTTVTQPTVRRRRYVAKYICGNDPWDYRKRFRNSQSFGKRYCGDYRQVISPDKQVITIPLPRCYRRWYPSSNEWCKSHYLAKFGEVSRSMIEGSLRECKVRYDYRVKHPGFGRLVVPRPSYIDAVTEFINDRPFVGRSRQSQLQMYMRVFGHSDEDLTKECPLSQEFDLDTHSTFIYNSFGPSPPGG